MNHIDIDKLLSFHVDDRPSWDIYFLRFAILASSRSTCHRRQHGAVITKDNQILATGYNASPSKLMHCKGICLREAHNIPSGTRYELCRSIHAEENAILQCAKHGISCQDSVMYITGYPCIMCARSIINCGIRKIILLHADLKDNFAEKTLRSSEVEVFVHGSCV